MIPDPAARGRNWALALLFSTAALNLLDRQIINVLAQDIKVDLSITDAQLGLLTGTAFGLFYSILGIPLGRLADRVDRVKLIAAALALWSAFTALCGGTGNFLQLFFTRMGVGVGEAVSQPASTALIPDLFPEERRTSALSFLLIGAPVGGFLGLTLGGYVGSVWGWRTAFVLAAIPGFLLALLMLSTMRDPRTFMGSVSRVPATSLFVALGTLIRQRRLRWVTLALICLTFFVYAPGAWLPVFFIRIHGMTTAQIGGYAGLAVGLGGVIGALVSGIVCDRLRRYTREVELKALVIGAVLVIPTLLVTLLSSSRTVALGAMFVFNICAYAYLGPMATLIQKEATAHTRALAIAACISVSNVVNMCVALPLVGALSDSLTPTYGAHAIRYALAASSVVVILLGLLGLWRAHAAAATHASA